MNIKKIFYFCIVSISGIFGIVYSFFHVDLLITSFLAQLVLIGSIIFLISGLMNLVNTLKERGKKYGTIEYLSFLWFLILLIEISYTNRLSSPDIQGITLPFFILGISLTLGFSIGILYVHFSVKKNKTKEKDQFIS